MFGGGQNRGPAVRGCSRQVNVVEALWRFGVEFQTVMLILSKLNIKLQILFHYAKTSGKLTIGNGFIFQKANMERQTQWWISLNLSITEAVLHRFQKSCSCYIKACWRSSNLLFPTCFSGPLSLHVCVWPPHTVTHTRKPFCSHQQQQQEVVSSL